MRKLFNRRKEKAEMEQEVKAWIMFNKGDDLEFVECPYCGREVEPNVTLKKWYPMVCPGCGRVVADPVAAEEE